MSNELKWKEYLLKSGLPLEYEVREYLTRKGCISNFEYTYLREDKFQQITEFSYDIDSSYLRHNHFVDLMIECKYRHESTKWLFLPESYGGPDEIEFTSFMHPNDHFLPQGHFRFTEFPYQLAPLCSKGIELTSEGPNPKTITQAISQLSYAMAGRITNGIEHQVDDILSKTFGGTVFNNIPIIVTTASLYRINEHASIKDIKSSKAVEEIATPANCLIVKHPIGKDLEKYNRLVFQKFINEIGVKSLEKKLNSFNKDLGFVMGVIASTYCPSSFVIIQHSHDNAGFDKFFNYINKVIKPDDETINLIKEERSARNERLEQLKILFNSTKEGQ